MAILFGHPTGNPNSHHAGLAHFEAGRLAAYCVPWMPSKAVLATLASVPGMGSAAQRLARRRFEPLSHARLIQGRGAELTRLMARAMGARAEKLSYDANDWLMSVMTRHCREPRVTAVHAYEDCSLWQFEEARARGKACIYDMPIGDYRAWQQTQARLTQQFADWLPRGGLPSAAYVRPSQKVRELELADLVLVPSTFVARTIEQFNPSRRVALASYGVDADFWRPSPQRRSDGPLRFVYAGQLSLRKGIPVLLRAWKRAALPDAELLLVGLWQLADEQRFVPDGVRVFPPCSPSQLREHFRSADVFVFPSFFEGFGLVLLEAMACGLPVIASTATAGPDVIGAHTGRLIEPGDEDALIEQLREFSQRRDRLVDMRAAARAAAIEHSWKRYRGMVTAAVNDLLRR